METTKPPSVNFDPESGFTDISQSDVELVGNRDSVVTGGSQESFGDFVSKTKVRQPKMHHRGYSKRIRRRLVYKNGECNISHAKIEKLRRRYLADIFTTLIDIKWRWSLLLFVLAFVLSWLFFGLIWWLICFAHGDFEATNKQREDFIPCVLEVDSFPSALLFSIETQHTIGYGSRQTTPECPEAVMVMMLQSCFGVIIQALMTGLVFAKLSRPKKRAETLMFSKNAVICMRDGYYCLLFRVGDMRKSHIVEAHVRGLLVKKKTTKEGEINPLDCVDIDIGFNEGNDRVFLVWPLIVQHTINENSPFWEMSYEELQREHFELIVTLEGIVESTGMTTQARSSYLPGEILWGHRFNRLVTFQKDDGEYSVDYSRFHQTLAIDMPTCSAKNYTRMQEYTSTQTLDSQYDGNTSEVDNTAVSSNLYVMKKNGVVQTGDVSHNGDISLDSQIKKRGSFKRSEIYTQGTNEFKPVSPTGSLTKSNVNGST